MSLRRLASRDAAACPEPAGLNRGHWLVLVAALFGWMFDGVELGLFSGVARPVLQDLLGPAANDEVYIIRWISYVTASFLLGAACGGVFFGWLGDRIGRVRAMALSILAYSLFTGMCYLATAPWQLGVLRFLGALGMGGEWALGVALVVECWPERLRPLLSGVIGAAGNVGYLLIGLLVMQFPVTPDHWRWIMLACATPAVLALFIMMFIPESQRWQQSVRRSGPGPLREIFTTRLIRPTLLAIGLASVALIGTWGCVQAFLPSWADQLTGHQNPHAKGTVLVCVSIGAILGGLVGPLVGGRIGRRPAYFCHLPRFARDVPGLVPHPEPIRQPVPAHGRHCRFLHRRFLRLAAALPARVVSHPRPGHRPGIELQLRPHLRHVRRARGGATYPMVQGRGPRAIDLPANVCHDQPDLPCGNGLDLVRAGDERQTAARLSPR